VLRCVFTEDKSNTKSGGVFFSESESITLVLFQDCNFNKCTSVAQAGALGIYHPLNATVAECIFINCTAGSNGTIILFFYLYSFHIFFFYLLRWCIMFGCKIHYYSYRMYF
jgi:hypothetical protein